MAVVSMVVGATTPDGATFVAKVGGGGPVRVAVADNALMTSPVFTSSQAVDAQGVAKVSITGLDPSTPYWWQTEDNSVLDTTVTGRFQTHPPLGVASSFTVAVAGDSGLTPEFPGVAGGELDANRVSNHPVHDTIRETDPLMFVHLGDWGYPDWSTGLTESLANRRTFYDDNLAQPRQAQLLREISWAHIWDDHDFANNDSDGTYVDKANAAAVYRERVPHYPLADPDGIWQSWQIGRVLFVAMDCRYYRDPNSDPQGPTKTMLGAAQKTWLENLLAATSDAEMLVWVMSSQWLHATGSDTWASFADERQELADLLDVHGWTGRMCAVYADRHAVGIDSGATNAWGGFPVLMAAALDASPSEGDVAGHYDVLASTGGRDQYGTLEVTDLGNAILVTLTAWNGTDEIGSHTFGISILQPVVVPDINRLLQGSHRATVEARVLTTFQTGDDPDGIEIPVLGGDVRYDSTAKMFATLGLDTEGHDGKRSLFPRRAGDLLAPYGTEVFVRRGVDVGNSTVWVPLGYFRLGGTDQDPTSSHPLALSGQDRMSGIVDGNLVTPRQFDAGRTVASVANELVHDIYPGAVVLFDDNSGQASLGRQLIVEKDRHAALLDIANSLGKVVYWDGQGFLRIEDAPDPEVITWEVKAGRNGVLASSSRSVSREGMRNGVVARGEGATEDPVIGIAVDIGINSPTSWFPPDDPNQLWFGQVPQEYSSPLLTDENQARKAAASLLRRYVGLPYNVSWGSAPNPALRPRDVVRITQLDGNREKHIVRTLTVPLDAAAQMRGTTKEQTLVQVAQLLPAGNIVGVEE